MIATSETTSIFRRFTPSASALVCGTIYLLCFSTLATATISHFGFPLDDSWIHQEIARNLAQYHTLGFVPGRLTAGSTSLLWTVILATAQVILPGVHPIVFCLVFNGVLLTAVGIVLKALTENDRIPSWTSWCVAIAPALSGNFLWLGLTGMEHVLFILLCLLLIQLWSLEEPARSGIDSPLMFMSGLLLVSTRPEGVLLIVLLTISSTVFPQSIFGRRLVDGLLLVAGAACALAASGWINLRTSGKFVPPTMAGRRLLALTRSHYLIMSWFQVIKTWDYSRYLNDYWTHPKLGIEIPLFVGLSSIILIALWQLWSLRALRFLFTATWGAAIFVMYGVELPTTGHGGRYLAIPMMVCLSLLLLGTGYLLRWIFRNNNAFKVALAAAMMLSGVESQWKWRIATAADIDQINSEHGVVANWLASTLPAEELASPKVAIFDIGRIGYLLHGNLLDLGALVNPDFLPYLMSHRTPEYLKQHRVQYLVIPGKAVLPPGRPHTDDMRFEELLSLRHNRSVSLTLIQMICADPQVVATAESSTGTAAACQRIYRLTYTDPEAH